MEVLVVVFVGLMVVAVAGPAAQKSRFDAYRAACAKNLSEIGKAMQIYANDYDGEFPRSGGRNSTWAFSVADWQAANRYRAYGLASDGSGGRATISSCFYLLVKYAEVAPGAFVCPGDAGTTVFDPAGAGATEPIRLWDFGPEAANHCSYAYHKPFGLYALSTASPPGVAVAADRNPWFSPPGGKAKDFAKFNHAGNREAVKAGNSASHENEGQNVLFLDGRVTFETEPFCGVDKDNIYTSWDSNAGDIRQGRVPTWGTEPMDRTDSLLINDSPISKATLTIQPKDVNSADLKQTAIVPTLDSPMPEHKNVIWCGTFQIAWDRFKNDIIKEPVQLIGAEDLAGRLNRSEFSPENLEAKSYYATAGFVKDGILEEIQRQMAKRFPSEPKPVFSELYRELEEASIAYCFLDLNAGFKHPFYTNNDAFAFADSRGTRSNVTSFSVHTPVPDQNSDRVREQVEILYDNYKLRSSPAAAEFVIDLCRYTEPYQVVLACVPRENTLGGSLRSIEQKIASFKQHPQYDSRRKLVPMDELAVPDILYKLTHHFKELEGKFLANPEWQKKDYFIFEARQMVQFSLNRTGVILKSEARLGAGAGLPRQLYFNRPFLICVQKRGAEFSPFFVMWVDNAELMNKR